MNSAVDTRHKVLFWVLMLAAQIGAFLHFKDLADISQWVVQSSREFTMGVWYARWPMAVATLLALAGAVYLWRQHRDLLSGKLVTALVILCLFFWYSGMLNTLLMFRPQQNEGQALFVSVDEAPRYLQEMLSKSYDKDQFESIDDVHVSGRAGDGQIHSIAQEMNTDAAHVRMAVFERQVFVVPRAHRVMAKVRAQVSSRFIRVGCLESRVSRQCDLP
ncbi:hypothetical protein ACFL1V_08045 [Pseudomonadota bacterium]